MGRLLAAASLIALAASAATAQERPAGAKAAYHAPNNAWGQPDLQGNWTTATITPLTRDPKLGERNVLPKPEADAIEQATHAHIARAAPPPPPRPPAKPLTTPPSPAPTTPRYH